MYLILKIYMHKKICFFSLHNSIKTKVKDRPIPNYIQDYFKGHCSLPKNVL